MKKRKLQILGLIFGLTSMATLYAQEQTPLLHEDFGMGYTAPTGWTIMPGANDANMGWNLSRTIGMGYGGEGGFLTAAGTMSFWDRDEWVITPSVTLVKGKTYEITFYAKLPGYTENENTFAEIFRVTAGTSSSKDAQTEELLKISTPQSGEYTKFTAEFTAKASRPYYFGFNICTPKLETFSMPGISLDEISISEKAEELSKDASLKTLTVNDIEIEIVSGKTSYDYELNDNTAIPVVTATATDDAAKVTVTQATTIPGSATIKVVPQSGEADAVSYTINFTYAQKSTLLHEDFGMGYTTPAGWTIMPGANDANMGWNLSRTIGMGYGGEGGFLTAAGTMSFWDRDEWVITPSVTLVKGKTYEITFYAKLPGYTENENTFAEIFRVTAGTSSSKDAQTEELLKISTPQSGEYTKFTAEFTAKASRPYYFGFNICTPKLETFSMPGISLDEISISEKAEELSKDASLKTLTVNDIEIEIVSGKTSYDYELNDNTAIPVVTATATDDAAKVTVTQATTIPGSATIKVVPQSGEADAVSYTINFTYDPLNGYDKQKITDQIIYNGKMIFNPSHLLLEVFDTTGRIVTKSIDDINTESLKKGVYIVRIIGTTHFMKILK